MGRFNRSCESLGGKPCYDDGSVLQADRVFDTMTEEGLDGVWKELEYSYNDIFNQPV